MGAGSAWIIHDQWICTAAHNLLDQDYGSTGVSSLTWSSNVLFVPGFNQYSGDSLSPSATNAYRVTQAVVQPWFVKKNGPIEGRGQTAFDFAFCKVDRPFNARFARLPIQKQSDYSVFSENRVITLGYPGGAAFDYGQHLWQCKGKYLYREKLGYKSTFCPVKASSLGSGVSGGPWITKDGEKYYSVELSSGPSSSHNDSFLPVNPNSIKIMSTKSPFFSESAIDDLLVKGVRHSFSWNNVA